MKFLSKMPLPWDIVIFLTVSSIGFAFSVSQMTERKLAATSESREMHETIGGSLDLGCVDRLADSPRWTDSAENIRLKGKFCHLSRAAIRHVEIVGIRNTTNGSDGTAFLQPQGSGFFTDYIALVKGRNLIQIEWKDNAKAGARMVTAEIIER